MAGPEGVRPEGAAVGPALTLVPGRYRCSGAAMEMTEGLPWSTPGGWRKHLVGCFRCSMLDLALDCPSSVE